MSREFKWERQLFYSLRWPIYVFNSVVNTELLSSSHLSNIDTTKLKNSNVLRNLDSKLSHLEGSQCQDLEKLLQEYKDLFPGVPSSTDQIYHDVDVGNASPIKQRP